jgi:hypothetical protein
MNESTNSEISDLKPIAKIDRVVLDLKSVEVLNTLTEQVKKEIGHIVDLNQKDLVNFIIQQRSQRFSEDELTHLKTSSFDLVKALKRATQDAIKAKLGGTPIDLTEVLKIIQTQSVNELSPPKTARGRKKKSEQSPLRNDPTGMADKAPAVANNELNTNEPSQFNLPKDTNLIKNTDLINS